MGNYSDVFKITNLFRLIIYLIFRFIFNSLSFFIFSMNKYFFFLLICLYFYSTLEKLKEKIP